MQLLHHSDLLIGIIALIIFDNIVRKSDIMAALNRRFFRFSIWTVIIVMASEIVTICFEDASVRYRGLHIIGNVLGFGLSPFIPFFIGKAICGFQKKYSLAFCIPPVINLCLTVLSIWFPIIFTVDSENGYMRGAAYEIYIFTYIVSFCYLFFQTMLLTKRYQSSNREIPVVLFFFVIAATLGQIAFPWIHISWLCVSFAIVLYYMYYCEMVHQMDALTGLLNRRAYDFSLREIKSGDNAAVIFLDIDEFKSVNDMYGHLFGDRCLKIVSSCIKKAFFKIGFCFRIGGDEFCVIVKKADKFLIERARSAFLNEVDSIRNADGRFPSVSIGNAFTDAEFPNIMEVVPEADRNMYRFKQERKNS